MNSLLQRLIQIEMVMESLMCGPQEPGHGGTGKHTKQHLKLLFDDTYFPEHGNIMRTNWEIHVS